MCYGIHRYLSDIQWGAVSDWFTGGATFLAATVALYYSHRGERENRDKNYASVYSWLEISPSEVGNKSGTLKFKNNTNCPIYEWQVKLTWKMNNSNLESVTMNHRDGGNGLLPPGDSEFYFNPQSESSLPSSDIDIKIDFWFKDALGRYCHRLPSGELRLETWNVK